MGIVSFLYNLTNGTTADAAQVMSNLNALKDAVNGNLDQANIKDLGVGTAELVDSAVTTAKIADGTVALADLAGATQNAFLKLLSAADKKASFGAYTASFSGVGVFGDSAPIAHGLGVVPDRVLIFQSAGQVDQVYAAAWRKTADATNFVSRHVALASSIAPNYNCDFHWIAIS